MLTCRIMLRPTCGYVDCHHVMCESKAHLHIAALHIIRNMRSERILDCLYDVQP